MRFKTSPRTSKMNDFFMRYDQDIQIVLNVIVHHGSTHAFPWLKSIYKFFILNRYAVAFHLPCIMIIKNYLIDREYKETTEFLLKR